MIKKTAISHINKHGMLLVYPLQNAKEPLSLWHCFWPKTKMSWDWNEDTDDNRVAELWHLRAKLSNSSKVVYSKFYKGRACFFSRELFTALLALKKTSTLKRHLSFEAKNILALLETNSPLSSKRIRKELNLTGKFNEPTYQKALKELFSKLLIVGYGEVDDGAFPSLAIGSTELLFEDLWKQAQELSVKEAHTITLKRLKSQPKLLKWVFESIA